MKNVLLHWDSLVRPQNSEAFQKKKNVLFCAVQWLVKSFQSEKLQVRPLTVIRDFYTTNSCKKALFACLFDNI